MQEAEGAKAESIEFRPTLVSASQLPSMCFSVAFCGLQMSTPIELGCLQELTPQPIESLKHHLVSGLGPGIP